MASHRSNRNQPSGQGYFWLLLIVGIGIALVCSGALEGLGLRL